MGGSLNIARSDSLKAPAMNDPTNGAKLITVARPAGIPPYELHVLGPADDVQLANTLRGERKEQLKDNLDFAHISGIEALKTLNEFDARPVTRSDLINFILTPAGQVRTIVHAIRRIDQKVTDADVSALGLDHTQQLRLACALARIELAEPGSPEAAGGTTEPPSPLPDTAAETSPSPTPDAS